MRGDREAGERPLVSKATSDKIRPRNATHRSQRTGALRKLLIQRGAPVQSHGPHVSMCPSSSAPILIPTTGSGGDCRRGDVSQSRSKWKPARQDSRNKNSFTIDDSVEVSDSTKPSMNRSIDSISLELHLLGPSNSVNQHKKKKKKQATMVGEWVCRNYTQWVWMRRDHL